jgi:hypothetical protein
MTWTSLFRHEIELGSKRVNVGVNVEVYQDGGRFGLRFNDYPSTPIPYDPNGPDGSSLLLIRELLPVKLGLATEELTELLKFLMSTDFSSKLSTDHEAHPDWEDNAQKYADAQIARGEISSIFAMPDREMKSREKYDLVTRIGYKHLYAGGSFYFDAPPFEGYWFDSTSKVLYKLPGSTREGEKFQTFLADRLSLNREDRAFRWLISGIQSRVAQHAARIRPHRLSFYDKRSSVLYINNKPGRMLRTDGGEPQEVDNGEDGILFLWDDRWEPWDYNRPAASQDLWRSLVYSRFSIDDSQPEDTPTIDELSVLLDVYVQAVLFRDIVPHRPILAHVGPYGSGKTSAAVWIGLILFGRDFQVIGMEAEKEDSVIAYLSNNVYGVLDNADENIKWLPDLLARTSTGQKIPKRKLYTTNELVEYTLDILIAITARATPWARPDVVSRLLLLPFRQPDSFHSEDEFKEEILSNRGALLAELVSKAVESVRRLRAPDGSDRIQSPSRLAGFFAFGVRTSQDPEAFRSGFGKVVSAQTTLSYEEQETLISVLKEWIGTSIAKGQSTFGDPTAPQWTQPMAASAVFGELSRIAKDKGLRLEVRTANALGMVLRNIGPTLAEVGISFKVSRKSKANYWYFSLRGER